MTDDAPVVEEQTEWFDTAKEVLDDWLERYGLAATWHTHLDLVDSIPGKAANGSPPTADVGTGWPYKQATFRLVKSIFADTPPALIKMELNLVLGHEVTHVFLLEHLGGPLSLILGGGGYIGHALDQLEEGLCDALVNCRLHPGTTRAEAKLHE